jgi:hypothetical protein
MFHVPFVLKDVACIPVIALVVEVPVIAEPKNPQASGPSAPVDDVFIA